MQVATSGGFRTRRLPAATLRALEDVVREAGADGAAELLGCTSRSINRWLTGAPMAPAPRAHVRLLAWLLGEGVDLVALAAKDPSALEDLRQQAADGGEPDLGPVLR